ncbi:MAG: tetratricopeptide repeat protein [Calditrichia bacterium]
MILFFTMLPAQELNQLFLQANKAYTSEKYQEAIELYQGILSQGYQSAEVYFNLGNCYYRLNEIGQAILYYEKARQLDPQDPDIQYNLELANLRVIDRVEMPPRFFLFEWWDEIKTFYSIHQLTYLVLILFSATLVILMIWLYIRNYRFKRLVLSLSVITAILTIFWAYIFFIRVREYHTHREAIILVPSVTVFSAPDENSTDVFVLHEGVKVYLDDQRSDWVKISLPDGKTGWIKNQTFGII